MASINEVRIMGNLGADPELRFTQGGIAVAQLRVATTKKWRDDDGKDREQTEWHTVVVWGKSAESVHAQKKKGDQVHISGYLQTRKWQDKDGNDRYSTEIVAGQWQWGGVLFTGKAPSRHAADDPNAAEPPRGGPDRAGGSRPSSGGRGSIDDDYIPGPGDDEVPHF